jgi:hypothetical protein
MLEEAYHVEATAALTLLGRLWSEKIAAELWRYSESLNNWLHDVLKDPSADWRERLEAFIAEQEAAGFFLSPESYADLVAYLEKWSNTTLETPPLQSRTTESSVKRTSPPHAVLLSATKAPSLLPPRKRIGQAVPDRKPSWWRPDSRERAEFYGYLTNARGCIHDLETLLASLANRIEAAKADEPCDVDAELNAIVYLIWRHNDLMESARGIWLSGNLGSEEFTDLDLGPTPASLDLPLFTDKQQAEWAKVQCKRIGERLKQRITFLDRVFIAAKILEWAGNLASLAIGGGILYKAFKEGGKIVLVKTFAKTAAAGGISYIAGKAVDAGLRAAGVEEETIQGVKHAAELVTWLLLLRKIHKSLPSRSKPTPTPASTNSSPPVQPPQSTGLVPKATVELGKWGESRLRSYLGGIGYKPSKAYITSLGKRYVDWVVGRVAHEAKAGINVTLRSDLKLQAQKDAELLAKRVFNEIHWLFFRVRIKAYSTI